jgi:hypothetical protein
MEIIIIILKNNYVFFLKGKKNRFGGKLTLGYTTLIRPNILSIFLKNYALGEIVQFKKLKSLLLA